MGKFEQLHAVLFSQPLLRAGAIAKYALQAGITDTIWFAKCIASQTVEAKLRADTVLAAQASVRGTPTILVNGNVYAGIPRGLERIVARELP